MGSFSNDDDDGSENVAEKKLVCILFIMFI